VRALLVVAEIGWVLQALDEISECNAAVLVRFQPIGDYVQEIEQLRAELAAQIELE
jgi:hypothetical protein